MMQVNSLQGTVRLGGLHAERITERPLRDFDAGGMESLSRKCHIGLMLRG